MIHIAVEDLPAKLPEILKHSESKQIALEFEGKFIGTLALEVSRPSQPVRRQLGFAKGMFRISDDFDEPLEPYTG